MYARVSDVTGPVDRIDAGIDDYKSTVLPAVQSMEGFQRAYLLVDRENGRTLSITVWDSREAMAASDAAADKLRAGVTEAMSARASVGRYEVVVDES